MTDVSDVHLPKIVEKEVSITDFRRHTRDAYGFVDELGHVLVITRRGKRDLALMTVKTYLTITEICTDEKTITFRKEILELINRKGDDIHESERSVPVSE